MQQKKFILGVRFRNEKVRINCETVWVFSPGLTDHLERSSPALSLKVSGESRKPKRGLSAHQNRDNETP